MRQAAIGNTGLEVSALGLGTVKLGRDQGVKYPDSFRIPGDAEARTLLDTAQQLGINLIDTAPAYGNSEERLGVLLAGQRHQWVVCSKVGEEFEQGESFFDFSEQHVRASVLRSLKRLQTDYLDIVLVHSDGNDVENIRDFGVLESLKALKQEGLIRATGMSTKTVEGGILAAEHSDIVMVTRHIGYDAEDAVIRHASQLGRGVFIKKALASGHACHDAEGDPVRSSMRYVFSLPGITSVIVGTITPGHLRHNAMCVEQALQEHPASP